MTLDLSVADLARAVRLALRRRKHYAGNSFHAHRTGAIAEYAVYRWVSQSHRTSTVPSESASRDKGDLVVSDEGALKQWDLEVKSHDGTLSKGTSWRRRGLLLDNRQVDDIVRRSDAIVFTEVRTDRLATDETTDPAVPLASLEEKFSDASAFVLLHQWIETFELKDWLGATSVKDRPRPEAALKEAESRDRPDSADLDFLKNAFLVPGHLLKGMDHLKSLLETGSPPPIVRSLYDE